MVEAVDKGKLFAVGKVYFAQILLVQELANCLFKAARENQNCIFLEQIHPVFKRCKKSAVFSVHLKRYRRFGVGRVNSLHGNLLAAAVYAMQVTVALICEKHLRIYLQIRANVRIGIQIVFSVVVKLNVDAAKILRDIGGFFVAVNGKSLDEHSAAIREFRASAVEDC